MSEIKVVTDMAVIRVLGAFLEIAAAIIMIKLGTVSSALKINALLGIVGPAVLIAVSALGLIGIAVHASPVKICMVLVGTILIFAAAR